MIAEHLPSSRGIERLCRENVVCMGLSADTCPHFTTIATFISTMGKEIARLFTQILSVCYANNVIGGNMFAIDGCKISSNCSKEWSGSKGELFKKARKIEESVNCLGGSIWRQHRVTTSAGYFGRDQS